MWLDVIQINLRFMGKRPHGLYFADACEKDLVISVILDSCSDKDTQVCCCSAF